MNMNDVLMNMHEYVGEVGSDTVVADELISVR